MKKIQLFLLHFAGGNGNSYDYLKPVINRDIEVHALELPGRGKRFSEELIKEKQKAIDDYFFQISKLRNDKPFVIFGHSMGATLALSVAKKLELVNDGPEHLIVSGNAGPRNKESQEILSKHLMNDDEFKDFLSGLGGIPDEVLSNSELFNFFGSILRADFELLEKSDGVEVGMKILSPIFAIMGEDERTKNLIDNWRNFTFSFFDYKILPGNHFFIHSGIDDFSSIINEICLRN